MPTEIHQIPCGHCNQPRCRLCFLYATNPRYRRLWGGDPALIEHQQRQRAALTSPSPSPKPRLTIADLAAKRRRCGEAKAAGKPCTEFSPAPAPQTAQPPSTAEEASDVPRKPIWAYGLTTVPQRRERLLPNTLTSLARAGFGEPVLFVDGCDHATAISYEQEFKLPVVNRYPTIRTFGNFSLGLAELWIRNPMADYFLMTQDDFVCSRNLREYLERTLPAEKGKVYFNLYLFDEYYRQCPRDKTVKQDRVTGWYAPRISRGLGAVALIFSRDAVCDLLSEKGHIVTRPAHPGEKSWRNIDGGIVDAMKKREYREAVHNPSLIQHKGIVSVMKSQRHKEACSFRGEDFDLLTLLAKR